MSALKAEWFKPNMFVKQRIIECIIVASVLYMGFWGVGHKYDTSYNASCKEVLIKSISESAVPNHVIKLLIDETQHNKRSFVCLFVCLFVFYADEDECTTLTPCAQGRICVNRPGTYVCTCPIGWTGLNCELGIRAMDWRSLSLITFIIIILLISSLLFGGWYISLPIILATTTNVI